LSNLPPNYKAGNYHSNNNHVHSAQVKQNIALYRELGAEKKNGENDKQNNGAQVHDTKTPIILS